MAGSEPITNLSLKPTAAGRVDARRAVIVCPGGLRNRGGIGRSVGYVTAAWADQDDAPPYLILDPRGTGHIAASPYFFLTALARFLFEVLLHRVALVHIHTASNTSALRKSCFAVLTILFGLPLIMHIHAGSYMRFVRSRPRPIRAVMMWIYARAARVIVLGEVWRQFAVDELDVPDDKVTVMHNAVTPAKASEGRQSGPPVLLFLGLLTARKGVPEILAALSRPDVLALDWRAVFAGNGAVEEYSAKADELGLAGRVEFTGWVGPATVEDLLGSSDVLLLPSHVEGLAMSALEAMSHGMAVIATDVGSMAEAIVDDETGLMVPVADSDAMAEAIVRLVTQRDLRTRLGKGAQRRFQALFDARTAARRLTRIYHDLWPGVRT